MKRLSSAKAKKALEFLAKKRLDASKVEIAIAPYFGKDIKKQKIENILCSVDVIVTFKDNKGCQSPLFMEQNLTTKGSYGFSLSQVTQFGTSYAKLLRWMEKMASMNAQFSVHGQTIFSNNDSIDSILVELDLEEYEEQKDK